MTLDLFEPERKSALSQWFTPAWIARRLALWLPVASTGFVLEPSAGSGELVEGLARAGWPVGRIIAVELDPEWCAHLRRRFPGLRLIEGDFLSAEVQSQIPWAEIRHVLTNPPYEGGLDIAFLELCLGALDVDHGRVVALVKTDIEYSTVRLPFWRDLARVERRARLLERPSFGRHVDGEKQGGAERNYVGLDIVARVFPRDPGTIELVEEEAWSKTDDGRVWTRAGKAAA